MKTTKLIIALSTILIASSCNKECLDSGTPTCIENTIETEKNENLKKVYEFEFQGEKIYKLIYSEEKNTHENTKGFFVDENCNVLCDQFATSILLPKETDPCLEIKNKAVYNKLVWEKFEFDFDC